MRKEANDDDVGLGNLVESRHAINHHNWRDNIMHCGICDDLEGNGDCGSCGYEITVKHPAHVRTRRMRGERSGGRCHKVMGAHPFRIYYLYVLLISFYGNARSEVVGVMAFNSPISAKRSTGQPTPFSVHKHLPRTPINLLTSDDQEEIAGQDSINTVDQNNTKATTAVFLLLVMGALVYPSASSFAIDHPATDYLHLNIPIPLPDADPRYFLSGGLCAAASHGVTTPIDVVKTRVQSEPDKYSGGVLESAISIVNNEGPKALLGGLAPTVIGYGAEGAMKFGLYETLKPEFARLLPFDNDGVPFLLASVAAGAVAALMLCPMERTRIRLVTDKNFANGLFDGMPKLIDESGFPSLFSGLPAMLSKQVPYTFAKQVSFDEFATVLYSLAVTVGFMESDVKLEVSFLAAFLASIRKLLESHVFARFRIRRVSPNISSFFNFFSCMHNEPSR